MPRAIWLFASIAIVGLAAAASAQIIGPGFGMPNPGQLQSSFWVQTLANDPNPLRRREAARALEQLGDTDAVPALARAAAYDTDRETRIFAGDAIASIRTRPNLPGPFPPDPGPGLGGPAGATATVRNWYIAYLGREPDPQGMANALRGLAQGQSLEGVRAGILGSDEYYARHGGNPRRWITSLFNDVLNRYPRPDEVQRLNTFLMSTRDRSRTALEFLGLYRNERSLPY